MIDRDLYQMRRMRDEVLVDPALVRATPGCSLSSLTYLISKSQKRREIRTLAARPLRQTSSAIGSAVLVSRQMPKWPALDARLTPGAIVWFGEMHGTEQSPRFVGDVVQHTAHTWSVQLGLEIPRDVQPQLDRYFASDGGVTARAALLDGAFWRWHDGRSSDAMLGFIERVRALRADGSVIDVVAFDIPSDDATSDARGRDLAMAEWLIRAVMVVLSGDVQILRTRGPMIRKPGDKAQVSAALPRGSARGRGCRRCRASS
ncbi:MAG: hypothetical protein H6Q90_4214 [Deltaproteobacteria bacterium]|nr:hypothetical protein [Deltaproteobacteria bacterium]